MHNEIISGITEVDMKWLSQCCGGCATTIKDETKQELNNVNQVATELGQTFVKIGKQYFLGELRNGILHLTDEILDYLPLPEHIEANIKKAVENAVNVTPNQTNNDSNNNNQNEAQPIETVKRHGKHNPQKDDHSY